ncbi:ly6/PLAUR domain-containing protein 3-like [Centroberyx affinis]|uniref:ly6/PLAUR domain-containing protein 3-like n=1 Tax=Centroberyx affinis TaxID=166261 RepID=UPI003A5BEB9A
MKVILAIFLTWVVFSTAETMQCSVCEDFSDPDCTNTSLVSCPSSVPLCFTATVSTSLNLGNFNGVKKSCVSTAFCGNLTSENVSINLGFTVLRAAARCCNSDNCNNQTLSVASGQPNGLQCASCSGVGDSVCSSTVNCEGDEDRCFNGTVTLQSPLPVTTLTRGCTSAFLCNSSTLLPSLQALPLFPAVLNTLSLAGLTCCEGNLCNRDSPTATSPPSTATMPTPTTTTTQTPTTTTTQTPTTTTTQTPTTASGAWRIRLGMFPLLLRLITFTLIQ